MNIISKIAFVSLFALSAYTQAFGETAAQIVTINPSNAMFRTVTTITLDTDGTLSRAQKTWNGQGSLIKEETTLIGSLHASIAEGFLVDHDVIQRDGVTPNCPSEPDHVALSVFVDGVEQVLVKGTSCVVGQRYFGPGMRFLTTIKGLSDLAK